MISRLGRTRYCGQLSEGDVGKEVTLMGWVAGRRNLGQIIFIDLRDREGIVQVTFDPSEAPGAHEAASEARSEYVIEAAGVVALRTPENVNPRMATGRVEVRGRSFRILSRAKTPPFPVEDEIEATEELRLRYRFMDLRRPRLFRNLRLRHRAAQAARAELDRRGFLEIETPLLIRSTPEGARDFLVPSRVHGGEFYALPQSPQILKQILMISGVERYYQLARCLRDEDLRADRQPEHTQIDLEMSFVNEEDVFEVVEGVLGAVFRETIGVELPRPFPRMTYAEAMERYGSDKPDLRFGLPLVDATDLAGGCGFRVFAETAEKGGRVKGFAVPGGAAWSRSDLDALGEVAKAGGAKGLVPIRLGEDGTVQSPVLKHLGEDRARRLAERLDCPRGGCALLVAGEARTVAASLGLLRLHVGRERGLIREGSYAPLWVHPFPLYEWSEEGGRWEAVHHPFCSPLEEDLERLESDPGSVRANTYDAVINGMELGSGSVRIHRPDLQRRVFRSMGIGEEEARRRFGFFLEALEYGAPPHAGIGLGFDRIVAILCGASSIREVIAFPKTTSAQDLMMESPSPVGDEQLEELHIRVLPGGGS